MTTNLYKVASGDLPLASDVDQYADLFNGVNDVGTITFAPQISAPTVTSVTATAAAGTALGIGTYTYTFTYVVGYKKTNNTYVFGGETTASSSVTVTTTSGNQAVTLGSLPTSWPSTAVGLRIYRTAVGGATEQIVTTLTTPQSSYTDTTADASLINTQPPSTNGTGTTIAFSKLSTTSDATIGGALTVNGGAGRVVFSSVDGSNNLWFGTGRSSEPGDLAFGWVTDASGNVTQINLKHAVHTDHSTLEDGNGNMSLGGNITLPNLSSFPAVGAAGTLCVVNGQLQVSNGTSWLPVGSGAGPNNPGSWVG